MMMAFRVVFGESLNSLDNHWGRLKRSLKQYTHKHTILVSIEHSGNSSKHSHCDSSDTQLLVIDQFWHIELKTRFSNDSCLKCGAIQSNTCTEHVYKYGSARTIKRRFRLQLLQTLTFRETQTEQFIGLNSLIEF